MWTEKSVELAIYKQTHRQEVDPSITVNPFQLLEEKIWTNTESTIDVVSAINMDPLPQLSQTKYPNSYLNKCISI